MTPPKNFSLPKRKRLSAALVAALLVPLANAAWAQDAPVSDQAPASSGTVELDKMTVTGSLIPQTEVETFTAVTVITAEDIRNRGFVNVADVLQQSSVATGGVQGSQTSASFTQGAETLSLFGLSPSYVKYLIDGRPMANYPALYNGSDTFNNISGIPIDLVERIEILPGGQSSLYGSDAIAGVVNIILKKRMDGTAVSTRYGWYEEGGGESARASLATGFSSDDGRTSMLLGAQVETVDPIWGYQRDITRQFFTEGTSAPVASRDFLVYSPFTSYNFMDPNNCANVKGQFGGTTELRTRAGFGQYCGSLQSPGYRTLKNEKDAGQLYGHMTFDLNDSHQLYGDVLYSREEVGYHTGSSFTWWGTSVNWGYFYDPDADDFFNLQRVFAPEDMGAGGYGSTMSTDKSRSYSVSFGSRGVLGDSNWDYDVFLARTRYELDEIGFVRLAEPINQYFQDKVLGPSLGLDPYFGAYETFRPNYAAFYQPISPADFASFTGYARSESSTADNMLRAQVTSISLFGLPGGDAGVAFAAEVGNQQWRYDPDARLLNGGIWGTTAVSGGGHRSRYAATGELRMPVFEPLTVTVAGRYDSFDVAGQTIDKPTYSLGIEYRPFDQLMLRGKYGTAFKAPTLSDQFQGRSGYYGFVTDYYNCSLLGFEPGQTDNCPQRFSSAQFFGEQSGSPDLRPINADVWSLGLVYAPTAALSFSVDYFSWEIRDEVNTQSSDAIALQEYFCRTGQQDINSPSCVAALAQITRDATGAITGIFTPKINVSMQRLRAISSNMNYALDIGRFGALQFSASYTSNLDHTQQLYPGDPEIDLLRSPAYSSDPKTKANASIGWSKSDWTVTAYGNRLGRTPNYRARVTDGYTATNAGTLAPWILYNASVNYAASPNLQLSFLVNNIFNKMPKDHSFPGTSGSPFDSANVNPFGRAYYVEARYSFGN